MDKIFKDMEGFSGAAIKATCTEAGYFAIREKRTSISEKDFVSAVKKIKEKEEQEGNEHLKMFG
jgi:ATP-dependent 26S proteasome regulatory subunit